MGEGVVKYISIGFMRKGIHEKNQRRKKVYHVVISGQSMQKVHPGKMLYETGMLAQEPENSCGSCGAVWMGRRQGNMGTVVSRLPRTLQKFDFISAWKAFESD